MTRTVTLAGYAAVIALMIACETAARRTGRVATLARVVSTLARWQPARLLLLVGWLWLGWHAFVRVHR